MSLLCLEQVAAFYGPSQALFAVDMDLGEGECLALLGRNGMGKSTTVNAICRMQVTTHGSIRFAGSELSQMPSHRAARLGIGLVPEGRRCFGRLSVQDNLISAARKGPWTADRVERLFPRLAERRSQLAGLLSGGEQQMLAIGRALMTNPRLLILDEATEGLAPTVREEIWSTIAQLRQQTGMAILVIDKTLNELRKLADRAVILETGRSVWSGDMATLGDEQIDRFLGV